jgi:ABC-type proline/glycine betaine transport system permease subunit
VLLQGSHSQHLRQLRLVWVAMLCALIMALPSGVAQLLLPLSARALRLPDCDALLAMPPALLGSMLLQVPDL